MTYIVTAYYTPNGTISKRSREEGRFTDQQLETAIELARRVTTIGNVFTATVTHNAAQGKKLHGSATRGVYKPTQTSEETDLVTLAEAARRINLSNLSDYKRKYENFPAPQRPEHPQLWSWESIKTWYESTINRRGANT